MYPLVKRAFDVCVSCVGIAATSPLILVIALLIKWDSVGPVIYKGRRVGRWGVPFQVLKFRTMQPDGEKVGASSTADDDPRITKFGTILRRYKLDELPQLINILKGEMSFVGPRPQVSWIVDGYSEEDRKVLAVRPGIADYAFVRMASEGEVLLGSSDPDEDYLRLIHPQKMRLSRQYVDDCSLWLDAQVFIDTALLSFFKKSLFLKRLPLKKAAEP